MCVCVVLCCVCVCVCVCTHCCPWQPMEKPWHVHHTHYFGQLDVRRKKRWKSKWSTSTTQHELVIDHVGKPNVSRFLFWHTTTSRGCTSTASMHKHASAQALYSGTWPVSHILTRDSANSHERRQLLLYNSWLRISLSVAFLSIFGGPVRSTAFFSWAFLFSSYIGGE